MSLRPVDPSRSRIVLVGTPAYRYPELPDVREVACNVTDLATVFTDPQIGGFDPAHCIIAPAAAGMAEIGDLLLQAASEAEDLLLFYYSGHGLLGARDHQLYLSLAGTRPDRVMFTALPYAAVRDACLGSRATSRVVILDSCFSGRAIGETLAVGADEVMAQVDVAGTYTLTSAPANRTALIMPGEEHTAFTERLIRLLHEGHPHAGAMLSLGDIYRQLNARLVAEGLPPPQQRGTQTADLLGLVRNRATANQPGDTLSRGLGITTQNQKTLAKKNVVLIPAYTALPATATVTYLIQDDTQTGIELTVNEGEDEDLNFVKKIGDATLFLPRTFPRRYPVEIIFNVSADSHISIEAHDGQTGDSLGKLVLSREYDREQLGFLPRSAAMPRPRKAERLYGISLGYTNSAIACAGPDGTAEVITGRGGTGKLPSAIYFSKDGDTVVGSAARRRAIIEPERVAQLFMRGMGARTFLPDDEPFTVDGKTWSPEELSALVLRQLAQLAQERYGNPALQAVLTVPAYFGQAERAATRSAAEIADLEVLRIISEPNAIAAAHGLRRMNDPGRVLIFDLGGTALDVTIYDVDADGAMTMLATGGDRRLGGMDFDQLILGEMNAAARAGGLDIETEAWARQDAYGKAEAIKKELSVLDSAVTSLTGSGRPLPFELTRAEFESLMAGNLAQVEGIVLYTIEKAGLTPPDLGKVLMTGGSSRIPAFQLLLATICNRQPVLSRDLDNDVVRGAAIFAASTS